MGKRSKYLLGICVVLALVCWKNVVNAADENGSAKVQYLSKEEILNAKETDYNNNTLLKWKDYKVYDNSVHDGVIPTNLLSDEVYCSMNLPSESRSDEMIEMKRYNGRIVNDFSSKHSTMVGIGAIYKTAVSSLPKNFTLCIGKIKTFAYLESIKNWVLVDEQPYPTGIYLYKMPWSSHSTKKCTNIQYYSDHIEIKLTNQEFKGYTLHFWGKRKDIDRNDIKYVACAYDFWIKEEGYDGLFTATIGIDAKDKDGSYDSIAQLFTGRGLEVTSKRRTQWGQTIPNSEYDPINDGHVLKVLYDKWWTGSK